MRVWAELLPLGSERDPLARLQLRPGNTRSDDYIQQIAQGVDAELEGLDFPGMFRQRDELLIQLIAAKAAKSQIP